MSLTSERVISDSLLSSSSGLPFQVRSFLGRDLTVENRQFNVEKHTEVTVTATHGGPCNTAHTEGGSQQVQTTILYGH